MELNEGALEGLSKRDRVEAEKLLAELDKRIEDNPLYKLRADNVSQVEFWAAQTRIIAAFAGNRFGKTTALLVRTLIECLDPEWVPEWLLPFKRWVPGGNSDYPGVKARIVCPSFQVLETVLLPELRLWCPPKSLKGGSFGKAYHKQLGMLQFANGSWIEFKTYVQDPSMFAGSSLHLCGYDEPPPWEIRRECKVRLAQYDGFEMFAMTPLTTNTTWVRREIWKNRESPDITVVRGSIHDNPTLSKAGVLSALEAQPDIWRRAVEFGDFIDVGGLAYPDFGKCVVDTPYPKSGGGRPGGWSKWYTAQDNSWSGNDSIANRDTWDIVVSIDPGIRNAAIVWVGFDKDNVAYVFDEVLLQSLTPVEYAEAIKRINRKWGIRECVYVIDPAARQRAQVNSDTVQSELIRQGIPTINGQNNFETGYFQVRQRSEAGRLRVNPECRGLRSEADDYALEAREDGMIKPLKGNDHRLDALRYALMTRAWNPVAEIKDPQQQLGWEVGTYDPEWEAEMMEFNAQSGPMGEFA